MTLPAEKFLVKHLNHHHHSTTLWEFSSITIAVFLWWLPIDRGVRWIVAAAPMNGRVERGIEQHTTRITIAIFLIKCL